MCDLNGKEWFFYLKIYLWEKWVYEYNKFWGEKDLNIHYNSSYTEVGRSKMTSKWVPFNQSSQPIFHWQCLAFIYCVPMVRATVSKALRVSKTQRRDGQIIPHLSDLAEKPDFLTALLLRNLSIFVLLLRNNKFKLLFDHLLKWYSQRPPVFTSLPSVVSQYNFRILFQVIIIGN